MWREGRNDPNRTLGTPANVLKTQTGDGGSQGVTRGSKDQESVTLQKPEGRGGGGRGCPVPRQGVESKGGAADRAEAVRVTWAKREQQFNGWNASLGISGRRGRRLGSLCSFTAQVLTGARVGTLISLVLL